jgi:hypothetical protein
MIEAQPGFLAALREITRRTGTLLLLDETHTWSAGPGGYTDATTWTQTCSCWARPPEAASRSVSTG